MLLNGVALLCAILIGFAAHRASLCNVRAVAEIASTGTAHMLWSLFQAVLWMAMLTGTLVLGFGLQPQPALVRTPVAWAIAGGWLFGVGAAVNGGCSLSTLHRLADGELGMLATLAAFAFGVAAWPDVQIAFGRAGLADVASPWLRWPTLAPALLALLLAWAAQRVWFFRRLAARAGNMPLRRRLLAPAYHLSVAAALMGLAGGLLYASQGAWSYTNYLRNEVLHLRAAAGAPTRLARRAGARAAARHGGIGVAAPIAGLALAAQRRRLAAPHRRRRIDGGRCRHGAGRQRHAAAECPARIDGHGRAGLCLHARRHRQRDSGHAPGAHADVDAGLHACGLRGSRARGTAGGAPIAARANAQRSAVAHSVFGTLFFKVGQFLLAVARLPGTSSSQRFCTSLLTFRYSRPSTTRQACGSTSSFFSNATPMAQKPPKAGV